MDNQMRPPLRTPGPACDAAGADSVEIDHLEALARKASQGPWHVREMGGDCFVEAPGSPDMPYRLDVCGDDYTGHGEEEQRRHNMEHIAATDPTTILALIEQVRQAETREQAFAAHMEELREALRLAKINLAYSDDPFAPQYRNICARAIASLPQAPLALRDARVAKDTAYAIRDRVSRRLDRELDASSLELIEDIAAEYAMEASAARESMG